MFPVTVILRCYAIIVREVITFPFLIVTKRTRYRVSLVAPTMVMAGTKLHLAGGGAPFLRAKGFT